MVVNAETLRRLAALRLPGDAMAEVLSIIADMQAADEARKSKDRARKIRGKSMEIPRKIQDQKGSDGSPNDITLTPSLPPKLSSLRSDKRGPRPLEILKLVLSEQTAKDVIAHRKAKRAPLTSRAAELLAAAFRDHGNPEAAAAAMIVNGWQGFKTEWMHDHQARAGPAGRSNGTQGFLEAVARDIENDRRRRETSTGEIILSLSEFRQRTGAEG